MNLPQLITFTGLDATTDIAGMVALSKRYPIEWGVLFSPKRQGQGRYPPMSKIADVVMAARSHGLRIAAHLCGQHSRDVLERGRTDLDSILLAFSRVQVNTHAAPSDAVRVRSWAALLGLTAVLQAREAFPTPGHGVEWLFDASGGCGISPAAWPVAPFGVRSGFAGGLRPENVAAAVQAIGPRAGSYWLDMETGARDEHDAFSLDKCRQVCEAVYDVRENPRTQDHAEESTHG